MPNVGTRPRAPALIAIALIACGGDDEPLTPDAAVADMAIDAAIDTPVELACTTGDRSKIKFASWNGCLNDGNVEFCIPMGNASVMSAVTAISPAISCEVGGGRAMCNQSTELLCFYPTALPGQCVNGAMTDAVWQDMCELSAIAEIDEIVPTVAE